MRGSNLLLFCFFLILITHPVGKIDASETIEPITIAAIKNHAPFSFSLPDGTHTGLYIEFWKLWSKTNNIPIKIVMASLEEGLQLVKNKDAIHAGLFINSNRQQWADFSLPFHRVQTKILYRRNYSINATLAETKNLKVSVNVASFQANYLAKNFPSITLSSHLGIEDGLKRLLNNEIDAIVADFPAMKSQLAKLGLVGVFTLSDETLLTNTVHALIAKGQTELVETINRGIENIPVKALVMLESKWLPTLDPFFKDRVTVSNLTNDERKWLQQHSTFSLGIDNAWYPYDFTDGEGKHSGISADYIDYAKNSLDIKIKPVTYDNWNDTFEAFKAGEIDILSAIVITQERAKNLNFTKPFFITPSVIVSLKGSFHADSMKSLNNMKLGLIRGFASVELIQNDYPDIKIHLVDSITEGLNDLQSKKIDAYIGAIAAVNNEINNMLATNLIITAFTPYSYEIAMAVRKGLEPLVPILNKTLDSLTNKQKATITNNWLAIQVETGTNFRTTLVWAVPILAFLLLIITVITRINRRLKTEISSRIKAENDRGVMEKQLYQSQKMEALGNLTGGIAHDFNNMLGVILGYTELIKDQLQNQPKIIGYVDHIHHAGMRGAKLTKKLLSFSSQQNLEEKKIDLNVLLDHQKDVIQKTLTVSIKLSYNLEENVWPIFIDGDQLEDAILNMCINSMHAMENSDAVSQLSIQTRNRSLNHIDAVKLGLPEGGYVELSITDTGCGLEKNSKEHIFTPFYSTKGNKGTGLGLSQVYGFVQRSAGSIEVISEPSQGCQFILYFPRYNDKTEEQVEETQSVDCTLIGNEVILIVDDEIALCNLAATLLTEQGYQVHCAYSGPQALKILEDTPCDLMLSDVIMPDMDGYQLASIVASQYPAIKIQLISGFSDTKNRTKVDKNLQDELLHKPYLSQQLFKRIRALLD